MNTEHDTMVSTVISYLFNNGFQNIKADLPGKIQPDKIIWMKTNEGHIPDATATINNTSYLFEIETEETLTTQHTIDQFVLFSAFAQQYNGQFCIIVPVSNKSKAEGLVNNLGIQAQVWTIS
jgi:hypothetical protein